ncbi:MAG: head maturation protease, ClpP-related [Thermoguttaceae bacterium]
MSDRKSSYSIVAKANRQCEVMLYDEVGAWGVSARRFREDLKAQGDVGEIHLHLNSPGGEVFDGLAIYNTLRDHPAKVVVHVDGMALSMASVIAMAGDEIEIADNAFMMIHNPMNLAMGDADDMRHMADLLDKVKEQLVNTYVQRTKKDAAAVAELMDAETWLSAGEAVEQGFADRTSGNLALAASFDPSRFTNCPDRFRAASPKPQSLTEPTMADTPKAATISELKAACPGATADFLMACLERGDTVPAAQTAWMKAQADLLAATQADLAAVKQDCEDEDDDDDEEEEEEEEPGKKPGKKGKGKKAQGHQVPGVAAGAGKKARAKKPIDDPVEAFNEAIRDEMKLRKLDRRAATRGVVRQCPDLHQAYLEATNAGKPEALAHLAGRPRR